MTGLEPGLKSLRRERDRIRPGDADGIEAERLGALDERTLQRLAGSHICRMIRADNRFPLVLIML
jgi:hypothetical protein